LLWGIVAVLVLAPVVFDVYVSFNYLPFLQAAFPFWLNKTPLLILSDFLFVEGGALLIFGALLAGVTLFTAWTPDVFRAGLSRSIFNLRTLRRGREIPSGFTVGLALLAAGIAYIVAAIAIGM
jgi:hypothetical protein